MVTPLVCSPHSLITPTGQGLARSRTLLSLLQVAAPSGFSLGAQRVAALPDSWAGSTIAGILTGAFGGIALRAGSRQLPWLSAYALQKLGLRRQARIVQEEARQSLGTILGPRREWRPDPKLMASVAGSVAVSAYDRDTEAVRQRVESPEPALQRAADRAPRDMPEATVALVNSEGSQLETLERAMPRGLGELTLRSHLQNPDRLVSDVEKAAWMR